MATEAKTKKTPTKKPTSTKKNTTKTTSTKKVPTKKAPAKKTSTAPKTVKTTTIATSAKVVQEENSYKNTIIAAIIIALLFIAGIFAIKSLGSNNEDALYVPTEDEKTFKDEYEILNGTANTDIEIIKNNNIVYIDMKKAAEMLESGSGVIYFGYAGDENARIAVPVLLDAMTSSELDTIYYVNLRPENKEDKDVRDLYSLNSKNKAKIAREATEEYKLVRTALANHLEDYVLVTSKGKKVNTGQKRLESPTVVSIVEGQVMGFHTGIVEGYEAGKELTKEQHKELLSEYTKVISSQLNKKCTIEKGC